MKYRGIFLKIPIISLESKLLTMFLHFFSLYLQLDIYLSTSRDGVEAVIETTAAIESVILVLMKLVKVISLII